MQKSYLEELSTIYRYSTSNPKLFIRNLEREREREREREERERKTEREERERERPRERRECSERCNKDL